MMTAARMRVWVGVVGIAVGVGVGFGAVAKTVKKGDVKVAVVTAGGGKVNPLLPVQVGVEALMPELGSVQKLAMMVPEGFEGVYTAEEWGAYRAAFGAEADGIGRMKSSGVAEFAGRMIAAGDAEAAKGPPGKGGRLGLARLLYLRAAGVTYRNRDGFVVANRAVEGYEKVMDVQSPLQVAGLWVMTNQMSKMAVTPKAERIRYSGIAARANMQLSLLLLDMDQVEAAEGMMRLIGYHEGWLKGDAGKAERAQIAAVRAQVKSTAGLLADLATKYEPARHGDDGALMDIYLYGRYVKGKPELVADLPARKPTSPMAQLAGALAAADRDTAAAFEAAETLKSVGESLPDGVLKQRTLFAALGYYKAYMKDPGTERERVKRTLARIAIEAVVGDGARGPHAIEPMAVGGAGTQAATASAE